MTPLKWLFLVPLLLAGCVVRTAAPPPRSVSREEAVSIAVQYASARGYQTRLKEIELEDGHWKVQLEATPPYKGKLDMRVDRWTGEIVRFKDKVKAPGQGRGHDDDHDDEDDWKGKGHDKEKDKGKDKDKHGHGHGHDD
jgi:hypothetical protein